MSLHNVKIARISTVPYFVVTQLKNQIEHIAATGAEVTVVSSAGDELSQFTWSDRLRCSVVEIPRSLHPFKDVAALLRLSRVFKGFDIVHSTTPKAGLLTALAGKLSGVPVRMHTFTGQRWDTLTGFSAWTAKLADRVVCALNTQCYADSASQRQRLIDAGIARPDEISVLGAGSLAGVDLDRFSRARFSSEQQRALRQEIGIGADAKAILFVGRICVDKGIAELLEAFRRVLDAGVDADLLLVGPLETQPGEAVDLSREGVARLTRVHHVGYSPAPEKYMAIADLFCLPSYREGFGTTIIEAAAMGLPALGTDISGLRDSIVDGVTGSLVPAKDAGALAQEMIRLLTSPEILGATGNAARERAAALFGARAVSADVIKEYERLLSRRR